jgi:O-methyltransferase
MNRITKLVKRLVDACGYQISPKYTHDFSAEEIALAKSVAPYTTTSPERIYSLIHAVEYVVRARVPGDIVECGVWRGGSMMVAAKTLLRLGETSRRLFLFDTFEGMSPPTEVDRAFDGASASKLMASKPREISRAGIWAYAPLDGVKRVMSSVGYPGEINYIKGKVEDTIPAAAPDRIALLRLDTDWYESTYHELVHLYPRLSPGGVLIIDDYGAWLGARRAVDQYLTENGITILLNRIDFTGRIAVKPGGAVPPEDDSDKPCGSGAMATQGDRL